MQMNLFVPVLVSESASCRVTGAYDLGYIKVKVNGAYRNVFPDDHPGIPPDHRHVFGVPPGASFDVWTSPAWASGDQLVFELYFSLTGALAAGPILTVVP